MSGSWFRKRRPEEGIGYSVASWQGVVATIAFVAAFAVIPIAAVTAYDRLNMPYWGCVAGALIAGVLCLVGFLGLVVSRSD